MPTRPLRTSLTLVFSLSLLALGGCGDDTVSTSIHDPAPEPPTPSPPATPEDDAALQGSFFPNDVSCGEDFQASVSMENTGTATWTRASQHKLGAVGDEDPLYHLDVRVQLPEGAEVSPGGSWTFEIPMTAPSEPGTYTTDWRMVHEYVTWFGESVTTDVVVSCAVPPEPPTVLARTGLVELVDHSLEDDQGAFNALGASLFWAAWAGRNDVAKLEANLQFLADNGFHYIRALGVVGDPNEADYWDGREIEWQWADYAQVIADVTDLAFDQYGLRVQWTLIGDGQVSIPNEADRYALVDTFLAMSQGREEKIIMFEIANEAWQNGFGGSDGIDQLRDLSQYMKDRTDILVAASAPSGHECEDAEDIYAGGIADIATIHFDRQIGFADGPWRPVRQPWEHEYCAGVPVGSNNEPIGPGSSVNTENDPVRLVSAAIATYVSNLPMYVFHSDAGVRGFTDLWEPAGADAFVPMHSLVPGNLASWSRRNAHWSDAPLQAFARDENGSWHADQMWPDLDDPTGGVVRAYGAVWEDNFFVFPFGILNEVLLEARQDMSLGVFDPMTGLQVESMSLSAGQQFTLSGYEALVIVGSFQ